MKITKVYDDSILPKYQTEGASGMDLHAYESGSLRPGEQKMVKTGIAIAVPKGFEGQIRPRSGLSNKGITCHLGTIDCDYRGEIKIILLNVGRKIFDWTSDDRIAQLVIAPVKRVKLIEVPKLDPTQRGEGGFGHTGV
jgi:dUTP pyrophosphatase